MSSRNTIQQLIDSKIFDNNNKEILASMVREVLEEMMNSDFNKTDDQLQNLKYNSSLTLAQKFNQTPQINVCYVGPIEIKVSNGAIGFGGAFVVGATTSPNGGGQIIFVDFAGINVLEKTFIITGLSGSAGDFGLEQDASHGGITYRRDSTSRISIGMREIAGFTQELYLQIVII